MLIQSKQFVLEDIGAGGMGVGEIDIDAFDVENRCTGLLHGLGQPWDVTLRLVGDVSEVGEVVKPPGDGLRLALMQPQVAAAEVLDVAGI
ncbi:hypothetical protein [Mucisphaera sp.]|uniref:hypothetical protein n=1 Tax=Mucisphaera sp. TaxID=2913024 RepID=UPI003D118D26